MHHLGLKNLLFPQCPKASTRLSYVKTWTSGLSLATLLQVLKSILVANCPYYFEIAQDCKVKDVFAELKLNNGQAAPVGEEMKLDAFTCETAQKSCMLDGICGT